MKRVAALLLVAQSLSAGPLAVATGGDAAHESNLPGTWALYST